MDRQARQAVPAILYSVTSIDFRGSSAGSGPSAHRSVSELRENFVGRVPVSPPTRRVDHQSDHPRRWQYSSPARKKMC